MEKNSPKNEELLRFRAEADALLSASGGPKTVEDKGPFDKK